MSARSKAMGRSNLESYESLQLVYAMADVAERLHGFPEIDQFAQTGWLPNGFFRRLRKFYALFDQYIYHNTVEAQMQIACQSGCGRCCHQPVRGMYSFEIINLYRRIRSLKRFDSIHRSFVDRALTYASTMREISRSGTPSRARRGQIGNLAQEKLMKASYPCPFLRNSKCQVYTDRPVICRAFQSVTEPSLCTTNRGVTFAIEFPPVIDESLRRLNNRLAFTQHDELAQSMVQFARERRLQAWG
jgi:Fe-S-cluster containining protein